MDRKCGKVLVITNKDDAHADAVISRAAQLGYEENTIRLNTEDFLHNCAVCFDDMDYHVTIRDSKREFWSSELLSVWYRRPKAITVTDTEDTGVQTFIEKQANAAMRGLFFLSHETAKWVNPLPALHQARLKLPQLKLASQVGFNVPATLVTNEPDRVKAFFEKNPYACVCNKSLDEPNFVIGNQIHTYLTKRFSSYEEILPDVDSVCICPTMFQAYIDKALDIRVVIMGDRITAVEIESQSKSLSEVDFRGVSPHLLSHRVHKLPDEIILSIREFMAKSRLTFSSMDLVMDREGKYFFIENNCNGQWLWLDGLANTTLVDDMVHLLYE